jgi:hypothetical protein
MHDYLLLMLYGKREYQEMWVYLKRKVLEANTRVKVEGATRALVGERQKWVRKMIKQARKINGTREENAVEEEPVIMGQVQWLFELDKGVAIECMKRGKGQRPWQSVKILQAVKEHGGLKACMRYLEYLVIESKVEDESVHTELVCLYV